jgi:transcriptional/translational regulatory protein YebC/TACO1
MIYMPKKLNKCSRNKSLFPYLLNAVKQVSIVPQTAYGAASSLEHIPANYIRLDKEDDIINMNRMLENLEDDDDVQNVWHNWENDQEEE